MLDSYHGDWWRRIHCFLQYMDNLQKKVFMEMKVVVIGAGIIGDGDAASAA